MRTLEKLNLSPTTLVTFYDARSLKPISILNEDLKPLLSSVSSFTHAISLTNNFHNIILGKALG